MGDNWGQNEDWDETEGRPVRDDGFVHTYRIPSELSIGIGLRWEFEGSTPVDLDASCVTFDSSGELLEAIFYNSLVNKSESILHSGDNTTGEDDGDDDETISIHFSKLPSEVQQIMICVTSPSGTDFTGVSMAGCRLINLHSNKVLDDFEIGVGGRHTATILYTIIRRPLTPKNPEEYFELIELNKPSYGKTFVNLIPAMQHLLDPAIRERHKANVKMGQSKELSTYDLMKSCTEHPPTDLVFIKYGVGWDGENDLDAVLIMMDDEGNYIDHITPKNGKTATFDQAAKHSGDKQHGFDNRGDDEDIHVDLTKVFGKVTRIHFAVVLHSGKDWSLSEVSNSYARMVHRRGGEGLDSGKTKRNWIPITDCKIDILKTTAIATPLGALRGPTALVAYTVYRDPKKMTWSLLKIEETTYGNDWVSILPFLRGVNRYVLKMDKYPTWRVSSAISFAVTVVVKQVRDLKPLEPHQFACHCRVWVIDRNDLARSINKTSVCTERHNIIWNSDNRFDLTCTLNDSIRVMCFEHALVGCVDIPLWLQDGWEPNQARKVTETWYNLSGFEVSGQVLLEITLNRNGAISVPREPHREKKTCTVM